MFEEESRQERDKQKRKNQIIIRGLKKESKNMRDILSSFLEREFDGKNKIKKVEILGKEKTEIAIVEVRNWANRN